MKHLFSILFFVGWFFSVQMPHGKYPGVIVETTAGGFQTEAACHADRADMEEFLEMLGVEYTISPACFQKEGA